jgi:hypothetical protein
MRSLPHQNSTGTISRIPARDSRPADVVNYSASTTAAFLMRQSIRLSMCCTNGLRGEATHYVYLCIKGVSKTARTGQSLPFNPMNGTPITLADAECQTRLRKKKLAELAEVQLIQSFFRTTLSYPLCARRRMYIPFKAAVDRAVMA